MNRTVAVTGGSGKLGRAVVAALIVEGWTVVNFDRVPSPDSRAHFIRTDLTDYGQVVEALSGIDEVHSGVNAVGYPFNNPPAYVPLDENVPATPEVVYALAKDLEEEMARQYCRWNPDQKMIGLRFSNVIDPSEYADFPSFENDPASRKWNLWLHRRP
jgi:nucleoside-diphosphate-sugar epimerase